VPLNVAVLDAIDGVGPIRRVGCTVRERHCDSRPSPGPRLFRPMQWGEPMFETCHGSENFYEASVSHSFDAVSK
jgi:hypothetical protein